MTSTASYSSTHFTNTGTWPTVIIVIGMVADVKDGRGSGKPGSLEGVVALMLLIAN
jgi:hypothetical protein